ncbi:4014_t:CDS:2 [Funneliformis geosporum]|uniref:4014_t:CDS:1 n=1 Tax=Funneliformis geosporum TaxID=1117311 RepID=A0A9W4WPS5_9GLOM|nr:4014_t:CDS:2 [Funneliformis geosporum]
MYQINISISIPSFAEFLETIDVLDILDLKKTDWQDLEIKIGLKLKLLEKLKNIGNSNQ